MERWAALGTRDERAFHSVALSMGPLHMSAVKEAMGALKPRLHKSLDMASKRMKGAFGNVRGGCAPRMDKWIANVRAESALAEGRLEGQAQVFS